MNKRKYLKALETLVYLAGKEQRSYWVLKMIYFADKEHLRKYGRQIFGDRYIAMKLGPVPSLAYDIVKTAQGVNNWLSSEEPSPTSALDAPNNKILKQRRKANLSLLSKTDIECLDYAYKLLNPLSLTQIHEKSSDKAYHAADENDEMNLENIVVDTLDNGAEVWDYLKGR